MICTKILFFVSLFKFLRGKISAAKITCLREFGTGSPKVLVNEHCHDSKRIIKALVQIVSQLWYQLFGKFRQIVRTCTKNSKYCFFFSKYLLHWTYWQLLFLTILLFSFSIFHFYTCRYSRTSYLLHFPRFKAQRAKRTMELIFIT